MNETVEHNCFCQKNGQNDSVETVSCDGISLMSKYTSKLTPIQTTKSNKMNKLIKKNPLTNYTLVDEANKEAKKWLNYYIIAILYYTILYYTILYYFV